MRGEKAKTRTLHPGCCCCCCCCDGCGCIRCGAARCGGRARAFAAAKQDFRWEYPHWRARPQPLGDTGDTRPVSRVSRVSFLFESDEHNYPFPRPTSLTPSYASPLCSVTVQPVVFYFDHAYASFVRMLAQHHRPFSLVELNTSIMSVNVGKD